VPREQADKLVWRTESVREDSSRLEQSRRGVVLLAVGHTGTKQLRFNCPPPNLPKLITKNASTLLGEFQGDVCVDALALDEFRSQIMTV
jgi:hypothetical protein